MKLAIVFPGQGAQNQMKASENPAFNKLVQQYFDRVNHILGTNIGFETESNYYSKSEISQPAILAFGFASFKWITLQCGSSPDILSGHSLGEITALTAAGSIAFDDAIKFVALRGKLMDKASTLTNGSMLAIQGIPKRELQYYCQNLSTDKHTISVANKNGHTQVVVSGDTILIDKLARQMNKLTRVSCVRLKVSGAFHSLLMEPMQEEFQQILRKIKWSNPTTKVISSIDGEVYLNKNEIPAKLLKQVVSPVNWTDCVTKLKSYGHVSYIDAGPGSVLMSLINKQLNNNIKNKKDLLITAISLSRDEEVLQTIYSLRQKQFIDRLIGSLVSTPHLTQSENYQDKVVVPFRRLESLRIKADDFILTKAEIDQAKEIFNYVKASKL